MSIVHNCVCHPLMSVADVTDLVFGKNRFGRAVDRFHDVTANLAYPGEEYDTPTPEEPTK